MSTTSVSQSAIPSLAAFTTPFFSSSSCPAPWTSINSTTTDTSEYRYSLTSRIGTTAWATRTSFITSTYEIQFPITTSAPACQPSGYDNAGPDHLFSFSPAVCPSGWVYYGMTTTYSRGSTASPYSMAWCCAPGFRFAGEWYSTYTDLGITAPCEATVETYVVQNTTTSSASASNTSAVPAGNTANSYNGQDLYYWYTTTVTGTETTTGFSPAYTLAGPRRTMAVHNAWHVSWAASDTSTMSPSLPSLTNGMYVPTWTPGEVFTSGQYEYHETGGQNELKGLAELAYFVYIGVPIIVVMLLGCCACCICSKRRKKREKREKRTRAATVTAIERDGGEVASEGTGSEAKTTGGETFVAKE